MSAALITIPVVGILAWLALVALCVWRHHGAVAERRHSAEQFRNRVLKEAEKLDADLIEQLLDAARPDDVLRGYLAQRAALVPGVALENPAGWQNDDLNDLVSQRFQSEVTQERHRFWTFIVVSLASSLGSVVIVVAILYHFHTDVGASAIPTVPNSLPTLTDPYAATGTDPSASSPSVPSAPTNPSVPVATPSDPSTDPLSPSGNGMPPSSNNRYEPRDPFAAPPVTAPRDTTSPPSRRTHGERST